MIVTMNNQPITVYAIANCDTVKKARAWLTAQGVDYEFHDFKKLGVPEAQLDAWIDAVGWEKLLNRKGNTWRGLDAATQSGAVDSVNTRQLILLHSSVVKRPVVKWSDGQITVGFDADAWKPLCQPA